MKSTGIVRRVDELGRIVLPKELRTSMHIGERDALAIFVHEDEIILRKYEPDCIFCGGMENLLHYKEHSVCTLCVKKLGILAEE